TLFMKWMYNATKNERARIPSYTQICRRQKELNIPLGIKYDKDRPVDIAVDSTGIKAFNKGMDQAEVGRKEGWI
ncbi:MAG: transposase, partial [Nitrososphaeria archaeon]